MCAVSDSYEFSVGDNYNPEDFPVTDGIFGANKPCKVAHILDGTSNTLMIGETSGGGTGTAEGHIWVSANICDTIDGINSPVYTVPGGGNFSFGTSGFSSFHSGGCHFAMGDGSVSFISQDVAQNVLMAMTTRNGPSSRNISKYGASPVEIPVTGPP